jgi:hypothetical protein
MLVTLDHLAAKLDPGYESLEGGQRHRVAHDLRLVQFGGVA